MNKHAHSGASQGHGASSAPPTITATAGGVVTGARFLPDHDVCIRVTYTADDVSDSITYTTDRRGALYAELPITPGCGTLLIAATDHRPDPGGACGLLWSNTETVRRS